MRPGQGPRKGLCSWGKLWAQSVPPSWTALHVPMCWR